MRAAQVTVRTTPGIPSCLRWFANALRLDKTGSGTEWASWIFTWPSRDQRYGVFLLGDEDYFRAGLALVLAEQLPLCSWTEPDGSDVRWLDNPDLRELEMTLALQEPDDQMIRDAVLRKVRLTKQIRAAAVQRERDEREAGGCQERMDSAQITYTMQVVTAWAEYEGEVGQ